MASWRILLWVAVCAALGFLWAVRGVLMPFALAWLVAIFLEPAVRGLGRLGVKRPIAVGAITLVFFGSVVGILAWLTPKVGRQVDQLRGSVQTFSTRLSEESADDNPWVRWNPAVLARPAGPLGTVDEYLTAYRPTLEQFGLPTTRRAFTAQFVDPHRDDISKSLQGAFNRFVSFLGGAASQVVLLCFTPLFAIFLMIDLDSFRRKAINWIPPAIRRSTAVLLDEVGDVFQNYVRGVSINISLYVVAQMVVLSLVGAPYSLLFAFFAGALYLIPNIGGMISMVTIGLVTGFSGVRSNWFMEFPNSWVLAVTVAIAFTVVTTTWDMLVTPRVVGKSVKLHPFFGMFVVFCGGALFGLIGMMLAYPVAGVLKLLLERILKVTHQQAVATFALPEVPLRHRQEAG